MGPAAGGLTHSTARQWGTRDSCSDGSTVQEMRVVDDEGRDAFRRQPARLTPAQSGDGSGCHDVVRLVSESILVEVHSLSFRASIAAQSA